MSFPLLLAALRVCLRPEPHLSRTCRPIETDSGSTHVIPGNPVYNLSLKALKAQGRGLCPWARLGALLSPGKVQGSLLFSSLMNMEEPSLSADCCGALFLSTTPLLSDQMSLFLLLLFPLC